MLQQHPTETEAACGCSSQTSHAATAPYPHPLPRVSLSHFPPSPCNAYGCAYLAIAGGQLGAVAVWRLVVESQKGLRPRACSQIPTFSIRSYFAISTTNWCVSFVLAVNKSTATATACAASTSRCFTSRIYPTPTYRCCGPFAPSTHSVHSSVAQPPPLPTYGRSDANGFATLGPTPTLPTCHRRLLRTAPLL
jgi:hypothetical protein